MCAHRPEASNGALGGENYSKASGSVDSLEVLGKVEVLQIDQPALIQPTEVLVSDAVFVETASEPVLTPIGQSSCSEVSPHFHKSVLTPLCQSSLPLVSPPIGHSVLTPVSQSSLPYVSPHSHWSVLPLVTQSSLP